MLPQFPILFVSAQTGQGIDNILRESIHLFQRASKMIPTGALNRTIQKLLDRHPPASISGKRFKIYYMVQSGTFPFHLKLFCNRREWLLENDRRYLENGVRHTFDLSGCPLVFEFIDKAMQSDAVSKRSDLI